ncbi:hypothetical protein S40288_04315 [Stachybotrys chartarum IBT 40288]|nr:hypothetical protein S40288_04315 [Stachybotrys chartarum IBT 40288]
MSLGVGVGDVILVSSLAWKLYKSCKDSSEEFQQVSMDLMSLHAVLRETEDYLQEHSDLPASRVNRLQILCSGCNPVLTELEALFNKYESLGTQQQRTWDRVRWGLKDLTDLRARLVCSTTMLNAFNIALINSSTVRIEKRLYKFMAEVQGGLREGSVVTNNDAVETIESPEVWPEFRRELEDVGISSAVVEEHKAYIAQWIKGALADGALDEVAPDATVTRRPSVMSTQSRNDGLAKASQSVFSDSGYGGSEDSRRPSMITLCAANEEFAKQVKEEELQTVNSIASSAAVSRSYTIKPKRKMDFGRLVQRLMVKDKAIIEAASDGDIDRVVQLLNLGVDVNVTERWGWSALSMCAYGGHTAIARLLLDHGANLDNVDVDGDTPTSLAASRGHTALVVMFDEERALRDLRLREADPEVPRR